MTRLPGRQVHSRRLKQSREEMQLGALVPIPPQKGRGLSFVLDTMNHDRSLVCGWSKKGNAAGDTSLSLPGTGSSWEELPTSALRDPLPRVETIFMSKCQEARFVGRAQVQMAFLVLQTLHTSLGLLLELPI